MVGYVYMRFNLKQNIPAIILFVFFLSLYVYTAAPGVYDGDSGEIAAAVNTLGLAHPTGFPLYMMTGKLFTLIVPIKDVAYRLNIFSALLTASALVFFYYSLRNLGNSPFASLMASFVLGLGRNTIWRNATTTNVYTLSLLFVSLLFFIFSKWRKEQKTEYLYWYGFLWGLSLGTHALMLIMVIPFIFMLWQKRQAFKEKMSVSLKILLLTFMPAIQYIYLFFAYKKNSIVNWGDLSSFDGFIYYITQRQYANKMFANTTSDAGSFLTKITGFFTSEFTIIFFVVALIGLIVLFKKDKTFFVIFTSIILANIGLMFGYGNSEGDSIILFRYIFLADTVLAMAVAFGIDGIINQAGVLKSHKQVLFLSLVITFIVVFQFKSSYAFDNRRHNYIVEDTASNILNNVKTNAVILSYIDHITGPLWYLQSLGYREDVTIVALQLLGFDWYVKNMVNKYPEIVSSKLLDIERDNIRLEALIKNTLPQRPVYSVFNSLGNQSLEQELVFVPQGILSQVVPKGSVDTKELALANKMVWDKYAMRNIKADIYPDKYLNFLAKSYALALYSGGIAYYNAGFIEESLDALQKSLEIFPHPETKKQFDYIKHKKLSGGQ